MSFRDLGLRGSYSDTDDRLNGFFVPVLTEAVAYDRVTGYFRSSALCSVARGLSHLIANGGTMRLIAGADLSDADIQAIEKGAPLDEVLARTLLSDPLEGATVIEQHRLETLAWLVRESRLEIRIGVPTDHLGRPLRRDQSDRYFHSKYGVLSDQDGNRIAFLGSNNESESGVTQNHETFSVYPSWKEEVWAWNGQPVVDQFTAHWDGHPGRGWQVIGLPEAVRDHLVARIKETAGPPPARDSGESLVAGDEAEQHLLHFVALAPQLHGGTGVGFATAGVEPLPHQIAIAKKVVATYPRSYILADEVGLGKTIEAGLIIRELLLCGRASRILILVPASVIRQWQEELDEKFSLRIPRLDGQAFFYRRGGVDEEATPGLATANPWAAFPILFASSHLARRRGHRRALLDAGPWDIVFVDEAHHARRRGSKATDSPNSLLSLLQDLKAASAWTALYLASATPMQMHAHEVWDLLALVGLTPLWGESAETFTRYFEALRDPADTRNWNFLQRMAADYASDPQVESDPGFEQQLRTALGGAGSYLIRKFPEHGLSHEKAEVLSNDQQAWLDEWLRRNTPVRDRVFRTTRQTLLRYKQEGILPGSTSIPQRQVKDRFIPMTDEERALYDRIERYISRYYDAYLTGAGSQKPLGFIMTVYRRRLTSSFLAIERSLRRRREVLVNRASAENLLDPDDLAAIEYSSLFEPDDLPPVGKELAGEVQELDGFLELLAARPPDESKMQYLHNELNEAFRGSHDTAIIFTQYTDTMDYIRDQLVPTYQAKVACWSGRGGERWDPGVPGWVPVDKAELKQLFRSGQEVKILIGTDSMSEGLNLQTTGFLVNYDMPWNFMRVEQRIGRVDRIGGQPVVDVRNYFYKDTVEEKIYTGISDDFDWFTEIVGPAQPVLGQVERAIEQVVMKEPGSSREAAVQAALKDIRSAIELINTRPLTMGDVGAEAALEQTLEPPAIDLAGLERVLLGCPHTASHFRPHPTIRGAYLLDGPPKQLPVTFNRSVLDTFGPAVTLLTYGTEEMPALLASAGIDTTDPERPKITGRELPDTLDAMEALIGSPETVPGR
ncbi:MAG: SNF2-related protein [Candidatus Dormibacteria bacterium]